MPSDTIEPQTISLIEYRENPEKYGLLDTWMRYKEHGKTFFLNLLEKKIEQHYKRFPDCDDLIDVSHYETSAFWDLDPDYRFDSLRARPAIKISEYKQKEKTYRQTVLEEFEETFREFLEKTSGLDLYFDHARIEYRIVEKIDFKV